MIVQIFLGQRIFSPYKEHKMPYNMEYRFIGMITENIEIVKISYILKANSNILLNFGFKVSNQFMQVKYIWALLFMSTLKILMSYSRFEGNSF